MFFLWCLLKSSDLPAFMSLVIVLKILHLFSLFSFTTPATFDNFFNYFCLLPFKFSHFRFLFFFLILLMFSIIFFIVLWSLFNFLKIAISLINNLFLFWCYIFQQIWYIWISKELMPLFLIWHLFWIPKELMSLFLI